jgi:hypothetical protein
MHKSKNGYKISRENDIDLENCIKNIEKEIDNRQSNPTKNIRNEDDYTFFSLRKNKTIIIILLCIILFGILAIITINIYNTYIRKINTEKCADNLVYIAKKLRAGKKVSPALKCPITGEKYIVINSNEYKDVYCPNPKQHNYEIFYVSTKRLIPEVIKLIN